MKKIISAYDWLEEHLLVYSLMFSTALIFTQIFMREVANQSLSWSEELSRYIFVWQVWLGTSIAAKDRKHISVELMLEPFKKLPKVQECIRLCGILCWFAFSIFLMVYGFELVQSMYERQTLSSGMRIPLYLVYLALPISSIIVNFRLLAYIRDSLKLIFGKTTLDTPWEKH